MDLIKLINLTERKSAITISELIEVKKMNVLRIAIKVVIIVLCFATICYANDSASEESIRSIWKSIESYLQWNNFWFRHFSGEECYKRLIGKKELVTLIFSEAEFGDNKCHYIEKDSKRYYVPEEGLANIGIITLYIEHTNMLFTIVKEGKKYVATIDIGEGSGKCKAGPLIKDSLKRKLKKEKSVKELKKLKIPKINPIKFPDKVQNLNNKVVLNSIKRSMSALIYKHYLAGELESKVPNSIRAKTRLLIGRFRDDDPFLLVYYEGDNTIYVFDFPSLDILSDQNVCMEARTRYMLDQPQGEDERAFFDSLYNRLKANSIELELDI
jgi:hypothetical protein